MCMLGYDVTLDRFMRVAHPLPRRRGNVAVGNHTFVNALPWMRRVFLVRTLFVCTAEQ